MILTCYWDDWACFWHASTSIQGRIFVSARIRAGSRFKRFLCFVLIEVRCFRVPPKMSLRSPGGTRTPGWRNSSRTSQETHYVSATKPKPKPVNAVWENSRCLLWEPYGTTDTVRNSQKTHFVSVNKDQPVNAVWGNSRCLLWEPYGTHRYSPYLTGNTLRLR
jgi:hypothetical protein